ncbi:hypothetical protein FRC17_005200, partial [Serendipita sp. 399]
MERFRILFESQPARLLGVALIASFVTLQAHAVYTKVRSERGKQRLNSELQELYRDDHLLPSALKKPTEKGKGDAEGQNNYRDANGIAMAIGGGAAIVSNAVLSIAGHGDGLIREQLARNYAFFGEDGMKTIRHATVSIVGYLLFRVFSGVGRLRLIDFDYVTLSSLNRHASATRADVGTPKVQSLKESITSIAPWVEVDIFVDLWNVENEKENGWLTGSDWVIDAIDNITTK